MKNKNKFIRLIMEICIALFISVLIPTIYFQSFIKPSYSGWNKEGKVLLERGQALEAKITPELTKEEKELVYQEYEDLREDMKEYRLTEEKFFNKIITIEMYYLVILVIYATRLLTYIFKKRKLILKINKI